MSRLFGRLVLCGAMALLTGPFLSLEAQEPQNTQIPTTAQKTTQKAIAGQTTPGPEASTPAKPDHASTSHRRAGQHSAQHSAQHLQKETEAEAKAAQEAAAAPAAPPAPPPPDWPANHQPNPATVIWDSRGLEIQASNSSLNQILHDVATDTGAKLEGLGEGRNSDQRIFGNYGPGPAREIISKLLDGSGYNVVMIGGSGDQPPQQIILSASAEGTPQPPSTAQQPGEQQDQQDQQDTPTEQNVEQNYGPPQYPMPPRNPFGGQPPRTPQEVQQQIQQRQQQLEQLRQQQQQRGYPQQQPQQQQPE